LTIARIVSRAKTATICPPSVVPDGSTVLVEQGHAIGRPSRIQVEVHGEQVRIGGSGVVVAEGVLVG